jgi:hypothetical protein
VPEPDPPRLFLLSPASCGGERARLLFNERARSELAARLRSRSGAPLGEVFSFLSSLYFRAKLSYANAFAAPPTGLPGVLVITTCAGLRSPQERVNLEELRRFGGVPIAAADPRYRTPLLRAARRLERELRASPECEVVLLGSVASGKYVELLSEVFGARLRFPGDFVGRGDMSRGGLLLRCIADRAELGYVPAAGALRHGARPARLVPRPGLLGRLTEPRSSR